ncbi:hypothetical protein [Singulisphaera sp. PoT]|uniref:hypothetical protein n=1 Tax=Singulisphaera sp. PoT TaxID=3411797 RepID=UPI003BF48A84
MADKIVEVDAARYEVPSQLGGLEIHAMLAGQGIEVLLLDQRHMGIPLALARVEPATCCISVAHDPDVRDHLDGLVRGHRHQAGW